MGDWLGIVGLALVIGTGVVWFRLIHAVRIPLDRTPHLLAMGSGALLGALAFVAGAGILGGIAGALAIALGSAFVGLRAISAQDRTPPKVSAGGPILDFQATDDAGERFELASLRGRPLLIKFFRGHW